MTETKIMGKPPISRKECALIVIDMQNDFCDAEGKWVPPGQSYYLERIRAISTPINEVLQCAFRLDVPVLYTQTVYYDDYVDAPRISGSRERGALKRGSWGAEIIKDLVPRRGRTYILEAQHYDKFLGTNLEMLLHGLGVRTLVLTGTSTNICIESTARAARDRDFFPIILSDCTATFDIKWQELSLEVLGRFFGSVLTSKELIQILTEAQK